MRCHWLVLNRDENMALPSPVHPFLPLLSPFLPLIPSYILLPSLLSFLPPSSLSLSPFFSLSLPPPSRPFSFPFPQELLSAQDRISHLRERLAVTRLQHSRPRPNAVESHPYSSSSSTSATPGFITPPHRAQSFHYSLSQGAGSFSLSLSSLLLLSPSLLTSVPPLAKVSGYHSVVII